MHKSQKLLGVTKRAAQKSTKECASHENPNGTGVISDCTDSNLTFGEGSITI